MMIIAIVAPTFIAGAIVGAIALICASINREDNYKSLMLSPPTRAAATTRRVVGWHGTGIVPVNTLHRMPQTAAARPSR